MLSGNMEKVSVREVYGKTIVALGAENPNIVALDADLSSSTQTKQFAKAYPDRFFNIGIAEQDLMCTAAGLSTCGKIPFVSTFAMFASGRAWDQVRNTICYPKFNVKIVATHGGVTVGEDGASHQALEDISLMRSIPNMLVIVPSDATETRRAIEFAAKYHGPVYIRLTRNSVPTLFDYEQYGDNITKAQVIKEGKDVTIVSNGETLIEVINAAKLLEEKGINAEIINLPTIKPLDAKIIIESAKKTGAVVTVENHSIIGGLGSCICECLSENHPVLIKRIGTNDQFGQSGTGAELLEKYGLTSKGLVNPICEIIERKSK